MDGLILAGGMARRMGGVNKAEQLWQGKSLIQHAYQRVAPQVERVVVAANRINDGACWPRDIYVQPDCFCWRYQGPLAALEAGLSATTAEYLLMVPCDAPRVPVDLRVRLQRATSHATRICYAYDGRRHQPLFARVHRSVHEPLKRLLSNEGGSRRVMDFYEQQGAQAVDMSACTGAFMNVNRLEQLVLT
ncbi:molybdopterin-guanine dinucleotide biosynthesis protein A [gamma proteobacterium HTCC5015]|nr:molybdopterin-guanine dinucleotide biosynthesis protein A [gamma proteobacterium HTCC5015]